MLHFYLENKETYSRLQRIHSSHAAAKSSGVIPRIRKHAYIKRDKSGHY